MDPQMHLHMRLDDVCDQGQGEDDFILETMIIDGREVAQLKLKIGEYQLIGAALGMGAEQTRGHLKVTRDKIAFDREGNFKMPEPPSACAGEEAVR